MTNQVPSTVIFRCPPMIREAIQVMAFEHRITPSSYVRRAIARALQADDAIIPTKSCAPTTQGQGFPDHLSTSARIRHAGDKAHTHHSETWKLGPL